MRVAFAFATHLFSAEILVCVLAALSLGTQHLERRARTGQPCVSIAGLGRIPCHVSWG